MIIVIAGLSICLLLLFALFIQLAGAVDEAVTCNIVNKISGWCVVAAVGIAVCINGYFLVSAIGAVVSGKSWINDQPEKVRWTVEQS